MAATPQQFEEFNGLGWVEDFIRETEVVAEIGAIKREVAAIERQPTEGPCDELDNLRTEIKGLYDAERREVLDKIVNNDDALRDIAVAWRENRKMSRFGYLRVCLEDRRWKENIAEQLRGLDDGYAVLMHAVDLAFGKIVDATGGILTDKARTTKLAALGKRRAELEAELRLLYAQSPWRVSREGRDELPGMVEEYLGLQAQASFPLKPECRWRVAPCNGGVRDPRHPDAPACTLDAGRMPAWERLRAWAAKAKAA